MHEVVFRIDGEPVAVADAFWVQYEPCGCVFSLCRAQRGDRQLLMVEDAEREFADTGTLAEVRKNRRAGYRVELMPKSAVDFDAARRLCPHQSD